MNLITTCAVGTDTDVAGHCPCCHTTVLHSAEVDGPTWTCPADLSEGNPHREDAPEWITEALRDKVGIYSNCADDFGGHCEFEPMPLHSTCYSDGTY